MNTSQPRTDEWLRSELLRLGAREFEIAALTLVPRRGEAALKYALAREVDHPIGYAIKVFDDPDWHPAGEKPRQGVNLHAESGPYHLPSPRPKENLEEARKVLAMLEGNDAS
jgi:hypothetical protein